MCLPFGGRCEFVCSAKQFFLGLPLLFDALKQCRHKEQFFGKQEVTSSILVNSSTKRCCRKQRSKTGRPPKLTWQRSFLFSTGFLWRKNHL
jgi:hypothetical protein